MIYLYTHKYIIFVCKFAAILNYSGGMLAGNQF